MTLCLSWHDDSYSAGQDNLWYCKTQRFVTIQKFITRSYSVSFQYVLWYKTLITELFPSIAKSPKCSITSTCRLNELHRPKLDPRCRIYGGKSSIGTDLCPSASVFLCQYQSTIATHSFNHPPPTLYNLLETKHSLLYISNQSVPHCKHFQPGL
jgi:hypothetical protein